MPAIVENYFVVSYVVQGILPFVNLLSKGHPQITRGLSRDLGNLSLNVEHNSVNDKQINFLQKLLFYSAMSTDIREDVELILRW